MYTIYEIRQKQQLARATVTRSASGSAWRRVVWPEAASLISRSGWRRLSLSHPEFRQYSRKTHYKNGGKTGDGNAGNTDRKLL